MTGVDDCILHVAVADVDHLRAFVLDCLGVRPEVDHVRTSLVYRHLRKPVVTPRDD